MVRYGRMPLQPQVCPQLTCVCGHVWQAGLWTSEGVTRTKLGTRRSSLWSAASCLACVLLCVPYSRCSSGISLRLLRPYGWCCSLAGTASARCVAVACITLHPPRLCGRNHRCLLPPATGITIAAVPHHLRSFSSAWAMMLYNCLGYAAAPFICGLLAQVRPSGAPVCVPTRTHRVCVQWTSLAWGFRFVMAASGLAMVFMVIGWRTAAREYEQRSAHAEAVVPAGQVGASDATSSAPALPQSRPRPAFREKRASSTISDVPYVRRCWRMRDVAVASAYPYTCVPQL